MRQDNKVYLKIAEGENKEETYLLESCDYSFFQDINQDGEALTGLKGGLISVIIVGKPADELLGWMFDHRKYYSGEITLLSAKHEITEQMYFENARCVDLTMRFQGEDESPCLLTVLKIVAKQIRIGNAFFEEMNR